MEVNKTLKEEVDRLKSMMGISIINEGFKVNPKYTHFAISKLDGKILNGWEYPKNMDKESIIEYSKSDMTDMDYKPSEYKLNSLDFLKTKGIDPFNLENWKK